MISKVVYSIKEVAKLLDISATTLRNWEKSGLINPYREENKYRVYFPEDVEYLKKVKQYSIENKMNISAIKSMLKSEISHSQQYQAKEFSSREILGEKWKQLRLQKKLSIREVAQATGIAPSTISKIENAKTKISLAILEKLSNFYNENLLYFYKKQDIQSPVVLADQKQQLKINLPGVNLASLTSLKDSNLTIMIYEVEPQQGRHKPIYHHGEEFVYILEGTIQFSLEENDYLLNPGDAIHFKSYQQHRWINPSQDAMAKMLWVYTH